MPNWPDHLDAVNAAPAHHRVLLENEQVRVLETRIAPGETVPLHTHRWPAVYYFVALGDFIRRDNTGAVTFDSRQTDRPPTVGAAAWAPPIGPHTLENIGATTIHVVSVELKTAAQSAPSV